MLSFKMKVTPEQSATVQKILFKNGYQWVSGDVKIMYTDSPYLYLNVVYVGLTCDNRIDVFEKSSGIEMTCEQFMKVYAIDIINQEETKEQIIGYKLIKPEYKSAALKITDMSDMCMWNMNMRNFDYMFMNNSKNAMDLKEAGVLDLWFEPVYEKEEDFPVGDWVVIHSLKIDKDVDVCDSKYMFDGKIGHIGRIVSVENGWHKLNPSCIGGAWKKHNLRKATPEEIEKAGLITIYEWGDYSLQYNAKTGKVHASDGHTEDPSTLISLIECYLKCYSILGHTVEVTKILVGRKIVTRKTLQEILKNLQKIHK